MTSPFNWKNQPSKIAGGLQKDHVKAVNARHNNGTALTVKARDFRVYTKAEPNVFRKNPA